MLDQQLLLLESPVTGVTHIFSDCVRLVHLFVNNHRLGFRLTFWIKLKTEQVCWMVLPSVSNEIFSIVVYEMAGNTFDLRPFDGVKVIKKLRASLKDHLTGTTLPVLGLGSQRILRGNAWLLFEIGHGLEVAILSLLGLPPTQLVVDPESRLIFHSVHQRLLVVHQQLLHN